MTKEVPLTDNVGTICLPYKTQKFDEEHCFVTGWENNKFRKFFGSRYRFFYYTTDNIRNTRNFKSHIFFRRVGIYIKLANQILSTYINYVSKGYYFLLLINYNTLIVLF